MMMLFVLISSFAVTYRIMIILYCIIWYIIYNIIHDIYKYRIYNGHSVWKRIVNGRPSPARAGPRITCFKASPAMITAGSRR